VTNESSIARRKASDSASAASARAAAHVARQQQHHREQRPRQPQHERGGEVGHEARPPGHAVGAQLQALAGQIDDTLGHVDPAATLGAERRQTRSVSLHERQLVPRGGFGARRLLE
jgi:hypothetical protein